MKKFSNQFKQAGISLLEVLLSLAIISIILVMAMQYFTTAGNNQKLNMVRTFLGADMAAIQGYGVNNSGDYSGLTDWDVLVSNGYLSRDTKSLSCTGDDGAGCTQKTPWGDTVTITAPSSAGGGAVTLSVPLPSQDLCQNLIQSYGAQVVTNCSDGTATVNVS